MSGKCALITGITGQDGSYLAEFLIEKGYRVYGMVRRSSAVEKTRIDHLYKDPHLSNVPLFLEYGDLSDASSIRRVLTKVQPDEIYNLGAQSHVRISFDQAEYTVDITGTGVLRMLEAIKDYSDNMKKGVRFYQASSSEMFGASPAPQNEQTPFKPRSPYAVAKVSAFWHTVNYRDGYGLHCSNGILFNHESERRAENFVTRKITRAAGRIKMGLQDKLYLGNIEAKRDWGYAKDYVEAMWLMLQQDTPDDYVIATGESHSVKEFVAAVFSYLDLDWQEYVEIDPYYFRPTEVDFLLGDSSKAKTKLKWQPKIRFNELVKIMTEYDLELAEREAHAMKFVKK
ncbi:MAG TPA: GDP-mannose 4,6-dehydratase [Bacteroidales bacterium]|nr:GDP-mannose 4,6-dehydratase [Bacteroidales bacterium]